MSDNFTLALSLINRGWYIFPCYHKDETISGEHHTVNSPHTRHGMLDATTDANIVKTWWRIWPEALIGIHCEKSRIFTINIDLMDGLDGWRSLTELQKKHDDGIDLVVGPIQQTPSGGYHLLFHHPDGLTIPSSANKLGVGLGLQSNTYICTGGSYRWMPEHGPNSALTEAPAWLLDVIRELRRPGSQGEPSSPTPRNGGTYWLNYYLDRVTFRNRGETGYTLACQLRETGLLKSEAMNVILEYAGNVPGEDYNEEQALASLELAYQGSPNEKAHLPGIIGINERLQAPHSNLKLDELPQSALRSVQDQPPTADGPIIKKDEIESTPGQTESNQVTDNQDLSDLDRGNIQPTGVGLRQGEIDALDAIGKILGKTLMSGPVARNALIRIAARRLIAEYRAGKVDLLHYFRKPEKPRPTLKFTGEE